MADIQTRIAALAPEQRRLLVRQLRALRAANELTADAPVPLTAGQRRLWLEHHRVPALPLHVVSQIVEIDGPADGPRLDAALRAVVARHAALRTTFELVDGVPHQVVRPHLAIPLERADLSPAERAAPEAALQQRARAQCSAPFDLTAGPLVRWTLVQLGPRRHALLFAAHNLVVDAWSYEVLLEDLVALYRAPGAVLRPAAPFADFVAWQRRWLDGPEAERQLEYWRGILQPPWPPPVAAAEPRFEGRRVPVAVPAALARELAALGRSEGTTLFVTLIALLAVVLRGRAGGDDVACGALSANRARPETARTVGYFLNPLPLRLHLGEDPSFRAVVRRARAVVTGAQAHGDIPCEVLAERLRPGAAPEPGAFFDVLFVFEHLGRAVDGGDGLTLRTRDVDRGVARVPLTLTLFDLAPGLDGWIEYDTSRADGPTVTRMAERLRALAAAVLADPDRPLSAFPD